ncbi:MAG: hypothetical protein ACF8OB_10580 [Phycisphaeraceae bacterium JB051]
MHQNICPSCGAVLPNDQINVSQGVAFCPGCGKLSDLRDVIESTENEVDIEQTPSKCFIWNEGSRIHIRSTLQSISGAFGSLIFALFWNGVVSVFVLVAISGLWLNLIGEPPEILPAPKSDGKDMTLGATLFLCIFLVPFVLIGMASFGSFLFNVWGRIDVILDGPEGSIRTGIPVFGWTRRFNASHVTKVTTDISSWQQNGRSRELIKIEADRTIKFGSQLNDTRRDWMRSVLKKLLVSTST